MPARPPLSTSMPTRPSPLEPRRQLDLDVVLPWNLIRIRWEPGPKPEDGIWAPWWYGNVQVNWFQVTPTLFLFDMHLKYEVAEEKLQALLLADSVMSIIGEDWLAKHIKDDINSQVSDDEYILLVLETARVEVDVLLNELAYEKYEAMRSVAADESIILKQRSLALTFSLLEKIIRLISNANGVEVILQKHPSPARRRLKVF